MHLKILRNTSMASSDLACILLGYQYLAPRGAIFGVQVTVTRVVTAIIPIVSALIPKLLIALGSYSQTH